jgi:hypothetical protein
VRAEWRKVAEIAERFTALNPYDPQIITGSILELEDENYDPDTGQQREIHCFGVASKRYALFVPGRLGRPEIIGGSDKRKRSQHGLGHLLPPNAKHPEISDDAWKERWWEHLLCRELGIADPEPDFFASRPLAESL